MPPLTESHIEKHAIELLQKQGYGHLAPERQEAERGEDRSRVVLRARLKDAIAALNPHIPPMARAEALGKVLELGNQGLAESNQQFHEMLTEGIPVSYQKHGDDRGARVRLVDFEEPLRNNFVVCDQFTVKEGNANRRADLVLFVNGLPMVVIELKNPTNEKATLDRAFTQLQNYKTAIASLFNYNGLLVISDGLKASAGSLTARRERFMAWKAIDGERQDERLVPQIETLIRGMLAPAVLLELIGQFTVFESIGKEHPKTRITSIELEKKIANYHQYHAVRKAVASTKEACRLNGSRKAGVVWHTQGSGKSLSMVFYAGKLITDKAMANPTLVVITDRNDLDDQLFDAFAHGRQLLRQDPVQAKNREDLKKLLKTTGGGVVFTTLQKFSLGENSKDKENFELLSERENIVVIADEAHRSHYGFSAKIVEKNKKGHPEISTNYGFAKYLRDALPNASFIGFTGTPIEKKDASTRNVFGETIDVYDIQQAITDGATVPIYYESRLVKVHLKPKEKETLDVELDQITESEESFAAEKAQAKWTRLEAIVGHRDRIETIAKDLIEHFEAREQVFEGKAMMVAMSRRIAVELYEAITQLRPDWHDKDQQKGAIKVIMTCSSDDPENFQQHKTTKQQRKELGQRFKNPDDPLKLVIVRDMWLTGFDAPCLHTLYVDKLMRGHGLAQAIARVNRVYKDKAGGLIVDYIGMLSELKEAVATYTESGGQGKPTLNQSEAILAMLEKYEVVAQMFEGFDYQGYFSSDTKGKLKLLLEAQDHILSLDNGKNRFAKNVALLSEAFALSMPDPKAIKIRDMLAFFQAIKARLVQYEPKEGGKNDLEMETAIKQLVDKALEVEGIIDVFKASGLKKPEISALSDEFLEEVRGMQHKNLSIELLKKILTDTINTQSKKNFIQGKKFSEMLNTAIKKYQNKLITSAEVIEELLELAKIMRQSDERGENLKLTEDEIAFYDALADNESAKEVIGDEQLGELARILTKKVRSNVSIDWTLKESVQAKLRLLVKKTLRKYGYPPDQQKLATENVLKQAELFANEWSC